MSLLKLNSSKDANAKLTRWSLLLREFNFRIEHCTGKSNELPNLLFKDPDGFVDDGNVEVLDRMVVPQSTQQEKQTELLMALDDQH